MQTKRILIFNVNWLGDVLFSSAVIRNIRYNFPKSFIACIITGRSYPLLEGNPYLNEIIIFDEKEKHKSILAKLKFIRFLKSKKFDSVFLLHRSFSRALICYLAGIPERVGYYTRKRAFLVTKKIIAPNPHTMHRIDYYLNIIEKAGLKTKDRFSDFYINEKDINFVEEFLNKESIKKDDFLVGVNPGGNWLPKRWPKEYWAKLADRLIKESNAKVIITGAPLDMPLAREIQSQMKERPIVACNIFNLKQFGALCKRLDIFITADTGPLHIANSVGTKKIIALYGPTHPSITGPYPANNTIILSKEHTGCKLPCYIVNCKDNRCMRAITVEDVIDKI